jgi:hypothetical protein
MKKRKEIEKRCVKIVPPGTGIENAHTIEELPTFQKPMGSFRIVSHESLKEKQQPRTCQSNL